jgi:hypothetical protein
VRGYSEERSCSLEQQVGMQVGTQVGTKVGAARYCVLGAVWASVERVLAEGPSPNGRLSNGSLTALSPLLHLGQDLDREVALVRQAPRGPHAVAQAGQEHAPKGAPAELAVVQQGQAVRRCR